MLRRLSLALLVLAAALLPGAAAAHEKQTLRLRFPRVDIPAGTSIEACVLIRVPTSTPFDLATWEIRNHGPKVGLGVLHFLVYVYSGEHLGEFAAEAGRVVQSRGCLDLGPADRWSLARAVDLGPAGGCGATRRRLSSAHGRTRARGVDSDHQRATKCNCHHRSHVASLFSVPIMRRLPVIVSLDATPINYDSIGRHYNHRPAGNGALDRGLDRRVERSAPGSAPGA